MSPSDLQVDTPEHSDPEGDNFEDASDTVKGPTPISMSRQRSSTSTRSLTDRSSSATSRRSASGRPQSSTSNLSNQTPVVSPAAPRSVPPQEEEEEDEEEPPTPRDSKLSAASDEPPQQQDTEAEARDEVVLSPMDVTSDQHRPLGLPERKPGQASKHPSSAFQEVHLDGGAEVSANSEAEKRGRQLSADNLVSPHSEDASVPNSRSTSRAGNRSEKTPSLVSSSTFALPSWASKTSGSKEAATSTAAKKMSGPWGWLSRKKTPQEYSPPHSAPRRDTTATTGSNGSNSELTLGKMDGIPAKDQLRERFKLARMKCEAGVDVDQMSPTIRDSLTSASGHSAESGSRPTSDSGLGIQSGESAHGEGEAPATVRGHKPRAPSLAQDITADPSLAPGTAAGINHGPSTMADPEAPVDWDLWQSVVYEGPSAVAKTSAAELSRSIASGIPSPIRGVVWQVLAESKSEELENTYRELIVRGTDKETPHSPNPSGANPPLSAKSLTSNDTTKESVHSSSSSIHSDHSTPATTNGMTSPIAQDPDAQAAKMAAAVAAERQKKAKEDIKKLEKTIRKDLGARTNYSKYFAAKEMQDDLFGLCKAYALYDEGVGYAQGMNFIVMPLLFNMPADEAFSLLVRLMNHYKLRDTFTHDMPGLHRQLYQFERLLEDVDPRLSHHLNRRGVAPSLYATQWFITMFAYKFPLQLVLRIYDLVLSEGLDSAVLKFGIALMHKNADKLLEITDMAALKTFLNERLFDAYIDSSPSAGSVLEHGFFGSSGGSEKDVYRADLMVQDACAVTVVTAEALRSYGDEFDAKSKADRERQTELEELRASTAAQTAKIRSLEERCQKSDSEHVQITQEMIRSRMENEELKSTVQETQDEVAGLRKTVEAQPAEVEQKLKDEMDRIMARNTEVQGHNRHLEEQMAEMEKDLVQTKMQFAEVNEDYETLKQKWEHLRRALGD